MTTGTSFVDIHRKRLLGTTDFSTRLLDHLRDLVQESYERSYRTGVIYDSALTLAGAAADAIAIGGTSLATDGLGHLLDIASFGYQSSVKFENALGTDYQVGLAYTEVPDGVQINTGTGLPEYIATKEAIGESADPDAVTDNTGTITFQIDSVCETGVSHAGRTARVYLKTPAKNAITAALAIEELTVAYTAGQNRITTAGTLGQDTVSTDPADYTVVLLGPSVKKNTTIKATDGFAYIGTVAGAGAGSTPSSFDITEQEVMAGSLSQLSHITRVASNDRLKIDVKAITGESGEDQIRVTDSTGAVKFRVDEAGNVYILGDLDVTGETTQRDLVQVISSETITDNLTAGDDDAVDSHTIKGEWKHTDTAGVANYFVVDGDTGRIGIGKAYDATWPLDVGYNTRINAKLRIEAANPIQEYRETDIGLTVGGLWRTRVGGGDFSLDENTAAGGDFSTNSVWFKTDRANGALELYKHLWPITGNTYDLGSASQQWRHLYLDGIAYLDTISLSTAAGEGFATTIVPDSNLTRDVGSTSYRWSTVWSGQFDSYYSNDSDWVPALFINRHSVTDTNVRMRVANYYVQTDATMVDGFGGTFAYFVGATRVGQFEWTRSGADDQVNFHWFLNGPTDSMTEQFRMKYDGGIESRSHLPFLDDTYDLGSASRKWANVYVTNLNVGADINPASDLAFDLGQSDNRWLNLYVRNIDGGPLATDYVMIGGPVYFGNTYDAPPVGAMNGAYTSQVTVGAQGNWATYIENGQGRVNLAWNAYWDGTNWRAWKGTGSGDGATRLNIWETSGALSWDFYFDDTSPASDGAILSLSTLVHRISSDGAWTKKLTVEDPGCAIWLRDTSVAVNAGGLWRIVMSAGDWILQENTAVGGDFSSTQTWLRADQSADAFEVKAHLLPQTSATHNLGGASNEWRVFYLSDGAGLGVAGNLVPTSDGGIDLGSASYRWRASYAASVYAISSSPRVYWYENDVAVDAGGLWRIILSGGKLFLQQNTAAAGDFSTSDSWFYTETSDGSLRWFAHMVPQTDSAYDLGNASRRWAQIYAEYLTLRHAAPRIHWEEDGVDPDAGGLWRMVLDGGGWRFEENTAAAGDFSTTQYWIQFVQSTPEIQVRRTFAPWSSNQIDLGAAAREWRDLYVDGVGYIDQVNIDSAFYLQLNGGNPYIAFDTSGGNDAFWYGRSTNTFFFRINGNDSILNINGSRAEFGIDVEPLTSGVQDLGSSSKRWGDVYGTAANFTTLTMATGASQGVASHLYPSAHVTYTLGTTGRNWDNVYTTNVTSDGVLYLDSNHIYATGYEAIPVGGIAGDNLTMIGGNGNWTTQIQGGAGRVNLCWNAYYGVDGVDPASWKYWDAAGDGATRCNVNATGAALSWQWQFADTSPASAGDPITWDTDSAFTISSGGIVTKGVTPVNTGYDVGATGSRWRHFWLYGNIYIGDGSDFYIQENGPNPYFKVGVGGSGDDAFWFSVGGDRFYFRIDGNDTAFRIDATLTQVGGNFTPYTTNVRTLGDSTHVWNQAYINELWMSGSTGLNSRKVFYAVAAGDASGLAMVLQSGGPMYVGAGEGGSNVQTNIGDSTESLHLCADQTISLWAGTDSWQSSDRKMHIDNTGKVYIADGGAPTSGGAAKLNIGATGTAGTTDLRGSHLTAYESTALSTTVDTRRRLFAVGGNVGNEDWLTISQYRTVGASGWNNAAIRLSREVDNSADVGAYIQFGAGEFLIKGHWRPESTANWDLGSTSRYWDHGYIRTVYLSSNFYLDSTGTDDTMYIGGTTNYYRFLSSSHAWYVANDLRFAIHASGANCYGYFRPVGGSYQLGQSGNRWSDVYGTRFDGYVSSTDTNLEVGKFVHDTGATTSGIFSVLELEVTTTGNPALDYGGFIRMAIDGADTARIRWDNFDDTKGYLKFETYNGSVYTTRLEITNGTLIEVTADLEPLDSTWSCGKNTANTWAYGYFNRVRYKIDSTTFDDQDDLALIDGYEQIGDETEEKEKAGTVYRVKKTQAALPWPMLGELGKDGTQFIDAADSATFLVGAIKQLHAKHKGKVAELEAKIDALAAKLEALTA
jgi:hypothetical protein